VDQAAIVARLSNAGTEPWQIAALQAAAWHRVEQGLVGYGFLISIFAVFFIFGLQLADGWWKVIFWFLPLMIGPILVDRITAEAGRKAKLGRSLLLANPSTTSLGMVARFIVKYGTRDDAPDRFIQVAKRLTPQEISNLPREDRKAIASLLPSENWGGRPNWSAVAEAMRLLSQTDYAEAIPALRLLIGSWNPLWKRSRSPDSIREAAKHAIAEITRRRTITDENSRLLRAATEGEQDHDSLLRVATEDSDEQNLLRAVATNQVEPFVREDQP
jgi:hypothetical protein